MLIFKILTYIIFTCIIVCADDSIVSTPYWNCDTCSDTLIEKVLMKEKPFCVEVYYKVSEFRKSVKHFFKIYKK